MRVRWRELRSAWAVVLSRVQGLRLRERFKDSLVVQLYIVINFQKDIMLNCYNYDNFKIPVCWNPSTAAFACAPYLQRSTLRTWAVEL